MTFTDHTLKAEHGLVTRIGAALANLRAERKARAQRNAVYRSTLRELQALTPRELADVGVAPSDIEDIARRAAYGQ